MPFIPLDPTWKPAAVNFVSDAISEIGSNPTMGLLLSIPEFGNHIAVPHVASKLVDS